MMAADENPLLAGTHAPRFDAIHAGHVRPAIDDLLQRCEQALALATSPETPVDYRALAGVLDPPLQALDDAWRVVCHLVAVANTPELRAAHAAVQPDMVAFGTRLSGNEELFRRYSRIEAEGAERLSGPERRAIQLRLRDQSLSGVGLVGAAKARFAAIQVRLAELVRMFSNRILDATDAFELLVPPERLAGVPTSTIDALRYQAEQAGHGGDVCRLTLQQPCLGPILRHADDRNLRATMYRANVTRASEFGPAEWDNTPLITEMLELRHERAALLGFKNHAELSLVPKMADSPQQVLSFLLDLSARARGTALRELETLSQFGRASLGLETLFAWDVDYAGEKLRQARHSISDEDTRPYFKLDQVLAGLLDLSRQLFGVRFVQESVPGWHPRVTSYRVELDGASMGRLMVDHFAREGKRAGAWMNGAHPRWRRPSGDVREALAFMVTNFREPPPGQPALLSHADVVTLFHEMGHALHFLLCNVDVPGVAGLAGVEWDAVELPSQLLENFAWDGTVIERISTDEKTGQSLPRDLFERMLSARQFQGGMQLVRQLEMAVFDMRVHSEPARSNQVQGLLNEVRAAHAVLSPPEFNRFQNGFSHVFAGGYTAGYYSYLWAEVLSADAWSVFEHGGVLNVDTGQRYRRAILERGGSRPMGENFLDLVGRAPTIEALLRQRGLGTSDSSSGLTQATH